MKHRDLLYLLSRPPVAHGFCPRIDMFTPFVFFLRVLDSEELHDVESFKSEIFDEFREKENEGLGSRNSLWTS